MTHALHPQSRVVGDVRAQIEQRRQQRNFGGQSKDSNKVCGLETEAGTKTLNDLQKQQVFRST
jgi:hypothetical protein